MQVALTDTRTHKITYDEITLTHVIRTGDIIEHRDLVENLLNGKYEIPHYHEKQKYSHKPIGVWVSVNHDWEMWCRGERFVDIDNAIIMDVDFVPQGMNLLIIRSMEDFTDWMNWLGKKPTDNIPEPLSSFQLEYMQYGFSYPMFNPDMWTKTAEHFDGIWVTEEGQWATRYNTFLYGWDCNSMCIFNPAKVKFSNPRKGIGIGVIDDD